MAHFEVSQNVEDEKKLEKNRINDVRKRLTKARMSSNMFEGISETELHHGLRLGSSTTLAGTLEEICYCSETKVCVYCENQTKQWSNTNKKTIQPNLFLLEIKEYLLLETGSMVHRYSMRGKPIRPPYQLGSTMLFTKMLWCPTPKIFACYIPHDDMVWIINASCKLLQILRNEFRIEAIFYSTTANQIVVVGTNKLSLYPMDDIEHPLNSLYTINYLDSTYGSVWRIEYSSLIETSSSEMSVAGSYLTNIYIMSLRSDIVIEGSAQFVNKKLDVTKAGITALLFHRTSEWIITGDQQGNVCGWNLNLDCTLSCSNDHDSQIKLIIRHPSICGFLTVSNDDVLQVWSCNLREKMESFREIGTIFSVAVNESATSLATVGNKLNCFHMNQLYVFYAPLSASATNLSSTTNPNFPTRVIVTSCDNTTRILSSKARAMNVQILSPKLEVMAASYSGITNRMYTIILKTGEILVSSVKTKPMKLKHVWVSDERTITCIVAYESFEKVIPIAESKEIKMNPVSTLIIAGTTIGELVVIEETSGKHSDIVAAHEGQIIDLSSSRMSRQLVSVGEDKCVKVWRIFPDLTSPLVLMCSVFHTIPITRVALLRFTVCLVSSTGRTKDHRVIMYNSSERTKLDHHRLKEHSDLITSIATLETLEICATSSLDKTIRIWNQENELVKILLINTASRHIVFSSLRGDIVLSAGKHLYRIPHENYLSPEYRVRIKAEKIPEELDDVVIVEDADYRIYEDEVDRDKLLHPVSSTPFGSLDTENSEAPKLELMLREQITLNLQYKEEDILKIKEGEIRGARLVGNKSTMSRDAWDKHIAELLESSKQSETGDSPDAVFQTVKIYSGKRIYNEPEIFRMIHGYSMPSLENFTEGLRSTVKSAKLPRSGFIPNSLIYKIEDEPVEEEVEPVVEKEKFKYEYPPEILYDDLDEDSHEDFDIRLTLSQIAELEAFGEEEMDE